MRKDTQNPPKFNIFRLEGVLFENPYLCNKLNDYG